VSSASSGTTEERYVTVPQRHMMQQQQHNHPPESTLSVARQFSHQPQCATAVAPSSRSSTLPPPTSPRDDRLTSSPKSTLVTPPRRTAADVEPDYIYLSGCHSGSITSSSNASGATPGGRGLNHSPSSSSSSPLLSVVGGNISGGSGPPAHRLPLPTPSNDYSTYRSSLPVKKGSGAGHEYQDPSKVFDPVEGSPMMDRTYEASRRLASSSLGSPPGRRSSNVGPRSCTNHSECKMSPEVGCSVAQNTCTDEYKRSPALHTVIGHKYNPQFTPPAVLGATAAGRESHEYVNDAVTTPTFLHPNDRRQTLPSSPATWQSTAPPQSFNSSSSEVLYLNMSEMENPEISGGEGGGGGGVKQLTSKSSSVAGGSKMRYDTTPLVTRDVVVTNSANGFMDGRQSAASSMSMYYAYIIMFSFYVRLFLIHTLPKL